MLNHPVTVKATVTTRDKDGNEKIIANVAGQEHAGFAGAIKMLQQEEEKFKQVHKEGKPIC